jgi:hypothetical protein
MRTFRVSNELYEQLKSYVVDPFDDTPEAVIGRLVEIVDKAKSRWSPFEEEETPVMRRPRTQTGPQAEAEPQAEPEPEEVEAEDQELPQMEQDDEVVLL